MSKNSNNAFIKWCNIVLKKSRKPETTVADLSVDFVDGTVLGLMAEVLCGEALKLTFNPKKGAVQMSNFELAMKALERHTILVNIHNSSLANPETSGRVVPGLIWQLICFFHIKGMDGDDEDKAKKVNMNEAKNKLLAWINSQLSQLNSDDVKEIIKANPGSEGNPNYDVENGVITVTDFEKSWRDGVAIAALVAACNEAPRRTLREFTDTKGDSVSLAENAIQKAHDEYEIPRLVDGSDMCGEECDANSNMAYLAYFPKIQLKEKINEDDIDASQSSFDEVAFLQAENDARVLTEGRIEKLKEQLTAITEEIATLKEDEDLSSNPHEETRRQRLQRHKTRVENSLRRAEQAQKDAEAEKAALDTAEKEAEQAKERADKAEKDAASEKERADKAEKDAVSEKERADKAEKDAADTQAALDEANDELARLRRIVAGVRELLA